MQVEDQYLDVLQNIEFSVVRIFRTHPDLMDFDVETIYNSLIQYYKNKQRTTACPQQRTELRQALCESVKAMCDLRLGEASLQTEKGEFTPPKDFITSIRDEEIVLCLKRLQKSVQKWTKQGGRQGYLNFVADFVQ